MPLVPSVWPAEKTPESVNRLRSVGSPSVEAGVPVSLEKLVAGLRENLEQDVQQTKSALGLTSAQIVAEARTTDEHVRTTEQLLQSELVNAARIEKLLQSNQTH